MLRIDQVLHQRYKIVRPLGQGGMGAVYEAIDERFGEPIALKEIRFESSDDRQKDLVVKAFEREAKALAKAQHEAVPYVRDYFSELDRQFLVMELVEGDDLAELLVKRQSPFPLPDCLRWMNQLLDALDYLHTLERPIIHRDIKPQNLKLNRRGKIKLLDFGIAKSTGNTAATISDQTFVGATLDYSPIEQVLRAIDSTFREYIILKHREKADTILNQTTDTRCDLYALGATFYHLLTNEAPPDSVKRTLEVWEDRSDPLKNPSVLNPVIPIGVSSCLLKAMAIEREDRFISALEMQTAIQDAIAEDKILKNSVYNDSWRAEQVRLQMAKEAVLHEHELMQAKTVKLLTDDAGIKTEENSLSDIRALPTERLPLLQSSTGSPNEFSIRNSSSTSAIRTLPEIPESTISSYLDEKADNGEKTTFGDAPETAQPVLKKSSKLPWIILAAALGVFAIGGIGGMFWMRSSDAIGNSNAVTNVNPSQTSTPVISPSRSVFADGSSIMPTPERSPRQAPTSTPLRTPEKTPQVTPTRTPRKTPPPKTPDPNCVYTNTCGKND